MDGILKQGKGALEYRFRHRNGRYIWIQDTFTVTHGAEGKPKEIVGSWADISDRKRIEAELQHLAEQVELRNKFIRETFGRYLTDEVVSTVLESPTGLKIGGEKRKVTMLMSDLRGFTSMSERLPPARVVAMLNRYLTSMVEIIKKYTAPSTSSSVMPSSSCSGRPPGRRTTRSGLSLVRWPCNWRWRGSTSRTSRRICPSWKWASASIPAKSFRKYRLV
jgi:hypothetical protein